jgi:uncharacterized integral membrane protein (TIGR00697 family)
LTTPIEVEPLDAPRPALALNRIAVIVIAAYAGAQVISQVTSLKIGVVVGQSVDMGTFVYPITFTLRDVVHKVLGRHLARTLIVATAGVNLFLAAYLVITDHVESDPAWGLGDEWHTLLGPVWRIVIASLIAMTVSELIDTEVYHWFVTRVTTRFQWARVLVSNAVSLPIDNIIFAVGAFGALPFLTHASGTLPWETVWSIFWVNLWVKGIVSIVSMPLIYVTPVSSPRS